MGAEDTTVTYKIIVKDADAVQIIEGLVGHHGIEVIRQEDETPEYDATALLALRGSVSPEAAREMHQHVNDVRNEWERDLEFPV